MKTLVIKHATTLLLGAFVLSSSAYLSIMAANAWSTQQHASANCDGSNAIINLSFTNTEDTKSMLVGASDNQTGISANLGAIAPHQTVTKSIDTGRSSLSNGIVTFSLAWVGKPGTDSRTEAYSGVSCEAPTPTPTDTPEPTPTDQPTATPTPTDTPEPTVTPTPVPQNNNTDNCDGSAQVDNNNANNNCNNNNNNNNNSNNQSQDQTQNNNQSVNITIIAPTPEVLAASTTVTSLPSTGSESDVLFGLLTLIPVAIKLRKLA